MTTSPISATPTTNGPDGTEGDGSAYLEDILDELSENQAHLPSPSEPASAHAGSEPLDPFGYESPLPIGADVDPAALSGRPAAPSDKLPEQLDQRRGALRETIVTTIVALLVLVLVYSLLARERNILLTSIAVAGLVTVAFVTLRTTVSPDRLRSIQTKQTLSFARQTLVYMRGGLSYENCQAVCDLLLPETLTMAVAMTDDKNVLGYAGKYAEYFPVGSPIHTEATHRVLASQQLEVFTTAPQTQKTLIGSLISGKVAPAGRRLFGRQDEADQPVKTDELIPAGIVAPLIVRGKAVGTLKLYYEAPHLIDQTQRAIGEGIAEILSTQLAMSELDRQVELTTKAELRALQSQINPHFLFNTINTIASLIRTDPARARELLREFAVFYRQTLENSQVLIPFERELEQTHRYIGFEVARFGEERIVVDFDIEQDLDELLLVPSFIIQPIVENSINHAMRPVGALHISVQARSEGNDVTILVSDDGLGMTDDQAANMLQQAGPSDKGTGIALRNVDARLKACFGAGSGVTVASRLGEGTVVTLLLIDALEDDE